MYELTAIVGELMECRLNRVNVRWLKVSTGIVKSVLSIVYVGRRCEKV